MTTPPLPTPIPPYDAFRVGIEASIKKLRLAIQASLDGVYYGDGPLIQAINMHAMASQLDVLQTQLNALGSMYTHLADSNGDLMAQRDEVSEKFELLKSVLREDKDQDKDKDDDKPKKRRKKG